jgi:S1-C subfamily serine protease
MIGVNTQILSKSGSSSGIGFAIPINVVQKVVPQLIKYGKVRKIGLAGVTLFPEYYRRRLALEKGVMVYQIRNGSSASKAGIKGVRQGRYGRFTVGDVIVGLEGQEVYRLNDIADILDKYESGQTVKVRISRDKRLIDYDVKLEIID